ncbi:MAG: hypothetical protein AVDCRST_MAG31-887, partial [uncultured Sphingomonas sp.]
RAASASRTRRGWRNGCSASRSRPRPARARSRSTYPGRCRSTSPTSPPRRKGRPWCSGPTSIIVTGRSWRGAADGRSRAV